MNRLNLFGHSVLKRAAAIAALAVAAPFAAAQSAPAYPPAQAAPAVAAPSDNNGGGQVDLASAFAGSVRAQAIYDQTKSDMNLTVIRLNKQFENSPEYRQAISARDLAQADVDRIRGEIIAQVSTESAYQDALRERDSVAEVLADSPHLSQRDRVELATAKLHYASEARQWENNALSQSPELKSAQAQLINANRRVIDLRTQFDNNLYRDPTWQASKRSLDAANIEMLTTNAYLHGVLQMRSDAIDSAIMNASSPRIYNLPYGAVYGPYPVCTSGVQY